MPQLGVGVDFDANLTQGLAAGTITPGQADAARAQRQQMLMTTPEGLQERRLLQDIAYEGQKLGLSQQQIQSDLSLANKTIELQRQAEADDAAQWQKFDAIRQDLAKEQTDVQQRMADATAQAAAEIDPNRYFSSQPAWAKVLSLLSLAVGGFAHGYSQGRVPNTALQMLDDAIARDIDAQKANIAEKRAKIGEYRNLYDIGRQRLGDEYQAHQWAQAQLASQVSNAAKRLAEEGRTESIRNAGLALAQRYDDFAKTKQLDIEQVHMTAAIQRRQAAMQAQAAQQAAMERAEDKRLERMAKAAAVGKTLAETEKLTAEASGQDPNKVASVVFKGQTYLVPKDQAKEVAEMAAAAENTRTQVSQAVELANKPNFYLDPTSSARGQFDKVLGSLQANRAKILSAGYNPSQRMEERAQEEITRPPRAIGTEQWRAGLEVLPDMSDDLVRARLRAINAIQTGQPAGGAAPVKTYATPK
jgi:hypothetical protein